ncbi:MAG TPA: hypothetical protein VD947_03020 [Patescibacteria group bacterium]|nr:hypothetical protein [Patescibacteria group bacterium]
MNNIDIKNIPTLLKSLLRPVLTHAKVIFILTIILLSGFLIFEINRLTAQEPTPEQITEQLEIIKRLKIDQDTINKIEQLEDQNIAVQSLFQTARDNPFQD